MIIRPSYNPSRARDVIADLEEMYRADDLLAEMRQDSGRVLVAGHDPADADRFGLVDPSFELAVAYRSTRHTRQPRDLAGGVRLHDQSRRS